MKRVRFIAFLLAVLGMVLLVSSSRRAYSEDAEKLFDEGTEAVKRGDFQTGQKLLSRAFELKQTVDIAANLAFAEEQLGMKADAANHLAYALALFPMTGDQEAKVRMTASLVDLKKGLQELVIRSDSGTIITVDGKRAGVIPLPAAVYVEPGKHVVEGVNGKLSGKREIEAVAGASMEVLLVLEAGAVPTGTGTTPPPSDRPLWPGIVLGGVAAAGLGVGIGLTAQATLTRGDVADSANAAGCRSDADPCATAYQDDIDQANTFSAAGIAGLAVGGAAVAGMIAYVIWATQGTTPTEAAWTLTPVASPDAVGLQFVTSF